MKEGIFQKSQSIFKNLQLSICEDHHLGVGTDHGNARPVLRRN